MITNQLHFQSKFQYHDAYVMTQAQQVSLFENVDMFFV